MKKKFIIKQIFFVLLTSLFLVVSCSTEDTASKEGSADSTTQASLNLSSQLSDSTSGEPLASADVTVSGSLQTSANYSRSLRTKETKVITDENGFYTINLGTGENIYSITVTPKNGSTITFKISIDKNNIFEGWGAKDTPLPAGLFATTPAIMEVYGDIQTDETVSISGTFAAEVSTTIPTIGEKTAPIANVVIDSNHLIGQLQKVYFSENGKFLSIEISEGAFITLLCTHKDNVINCSTGIVEITVNEKEISVGNIDLNLSKINDSTDTSNLNTTAWYLSSLLSE